MEEGSPHPRDDRATSHVEQGHGQVAAGAAKEITRGLSLLGIMRVYQLAVNCEPRSRLLIKLRESVLLS